MNREGKRRKIIRKTEDMKGREEQGNGNEERIIKNAKRKGEDRKGRLVEKVDIGETCNVFEERRI